MPNGGVERHNAATRHLYDKKYRSNWEFRGVDGEGGNVDEPGTLFGKRHQYLSLRCGPELLETGKPLNYDECFGFLADQPGKYIYVSYFFDYDVTMMIRTLPEKIIRQLLNRHLRFTEDEGQTYSKPVEWNGFQFDYLPHKEFKVRRFGQRHWTIINDVGQFFQGSFLSSLEKWDIGTPDEREMIRKGKSMRADFEQFTDETRAYNALECVLLEQLMTNFRAVCEEVGYVPKKWQGPGYLASAMLTKHGVPRRDEIAILKNDTFYNLALSAYYGGRFETTAVGPIRGPVYQYDINSAYPAALRELPCLSHGSWRRVRERPNSGLWFGEIYFNHPAKGMLYHFPVRTKNGNIFFPREAVGVYWSPEIEAAERAGSNVVFRGGWIYESHCDCRWFDFIDGYYQKRLALGKSTKGYVLKLAGNSIYGKIAQSIGYAPWANPVWAGLITALCRSKLIDAYRQAPDECYMLATDGIFMGTPLDLPVSNRLGEWEETIHPDGMFLVQPGVYFIGDSAKTRGVERGRIYDLRPEFEQQFRKFIESHGENHTVSVPVQNFTTARQAMTRNKPKLAGTWETTTREISFYWGLKRAEDHSFTDAKGNMRTDPINLYFELESTPYARRIGGNVHMDASARYTDIGLQEKERIEQQPDWVEPLL